MAELEQCRQLVEKYRNDAAQSQQTLDKIYKFMQTLGINSQPSNSNNETMATGELQWNQQNNSEENGKNVENVDANENSVAGNQLTFPVVNSPRNVLKRTMPLVGEMNGGCSTNEASDLAENQQKTKKNRRESDF